MTIELHRDGLVAVVSNAVYRYIAEVEDARDELAEKLVASERAREEAEAGEAKANAKLAAVGHRWGPIMGELKKWAVEDLWKNALALDALLASDPEVIAVVESNIFMGSPGVTMDSGLVISRPQGNMIHVDIGKTGEVGNPVTVTVTRNTKANQGE